MLTARTWAIGGMWAFGIVAGGIALGTVLGNAANPVMQDVPTPGWRLTGSEQAAFGDVQYVEPFPAIGPADGYRPDLDYAAEVWTLPMSAWELRALAEEPLPPRPEDLPSVSYGISTAELAANDAQAAAEDAAAAQAEAPAPAAEPDGVRRSELVNQGLY